MSKLIGFDYEIQYIRGRENVVANALSRVQGSEVLCMDLYVVNSYLQDRILLSYSLDPVLMVAIEQL